MQDPSVRYFLEYRLGGTMRPPKPSKKIHSKSYELTFCIFSSLNILGIEDQMV